MYDAFDVGAFQYLVKPVDEQKFAEVFGRAAGQIVSEAEQRKKKLVHPVPERREYRILCEERGFGGGTGRAVLLHPPGIPYQPFPHGRV